MNEQLQKLDKILDEYENGVGLGNSLPHNVDDINKYINMSRQELESLSPEDCAQISFILNQYVFHLQRNCNREKTRIKWAENLIKFSMSDQIDSMKTQTYSSYDERMFFVIRHDEYAKRLFKIKSEASNRLNRTNYLPGYIKNIADSLINMQRIKTEVAYRGR